MKCSCHRPDCPAPFGKVFEEAPDHSGSRAFAFFFFFLEAAPGRIEAYTDKGKQHRQKKKVGENQNRDADAGRKCQVLDDRDIDQHQYGKPDRVGRKRRHPRQEEPAEGVAGGNEPMGSTSHVLHDAVHFLCAVGDADGKNQKRHQDGIGIEFIAEGGDQAE